MKRSLNFLLVAVALLAAPSLSAQATTTLVNLDFNNTNSTYPAWGSTALTGLPGDGVSTLRPVTTNSGLFPTAPTNGYLVLAPNAAAVTTNPAGPPVSYYGGWAANATLATVNSRYTNGGFGQTNLAKISLTARVRARGLPTNGGVVILKLQAAGDNPGQVTGGYKRVMFEPVLLNSGDWVTIGGTLNDAALTNTTAQGTRYSFPTNAGSYTVLVELSGFNRFGTTGYVAYSNNPTVPSANGRKNPGLAVNASNVRVEVDDVKLIVTDAATSGFLPSPTPSQLLLNPGFDLGDGNWSFFEGAFMSTDGWGENGNANVAIIPGWSGLPYAGFMQNQIAFNQTNGSFFTLTFRGKFEPNYFAEQTLITFMNGNDTQDFKAVDISDQVAANLGEWATYTVRYNASAADLAAMNGNMSVKVQPLGRRVGAEQASALIDSLVLSQQNASVVGPQLTVKVAGASYSDGATASLFSPLIGYSTPYAIVLQNDGAQLLNVSSVSLSGTSFAWSGGSTASLQPGESRTFTATATPTDSTPLAGTLTVLSNDKETADQTYVVNLGTTPIIASNDFNSGSGTADAESLGWKPFFNASSTSFDTYGSVSVDGGALKLEVDSRQGAGTYPWYYGAKKVFASPGNIDLLRSSINVSLRASGSANGQTNKVQVYLESLNSSGAATGRISLGEWVDESTKGADPNDLQFPDGIPDRIAVVLPEGGEYTQRNSALLDLLSGDSAGKFDSTASAYQVVVLMTDFDFELGADKIVKLDSLGLDLVTAPFEIVNGGFESSSTDFGAGAAPAGWLQFPVEGVSKNLVVNGDAVYSASLVDLDDNVLFTAYAGSKAMKIYAQNYFPGGVWEGPSQTGVVYQEWGVAGTADLSVGQALHARGVAKVYGIDPLTGGSTFRYGFRYMDAANLPVAPDDVTTITASTAIPDQWVPLVANGTVPAGATKVQLIAEFVQNNSTDTGAVYLDDVSVGLGLVPATKQVGSKTYQLVWSDEFDGSSLNTGNWTPETGAGGWGNNEVQTYTANPENLRVKDGSLIIQAVKSNGAWTSARIKTQDKRLFKFGLFEFRAKLPTGVGPWPAAWMMGNNIGSVGWPACGEIDVLEWRGYPTSDANTVGHAIHSPQRHGGNPVEAPRSAVSNPSTQFHTYGALWTSTSVTFSVDGVDKATLNFPAEDLAIFQREFHLLLNMAIGGSYLQGQIDPALSSAIFEVDYVRVYQDPAGDEAYDPLPPSISVVGANPVSLAWGASYSDAGATAFDAGDNASVHVATVNPVDPSVPGDYWVTYTAQDSTGNSTNTNRLVKVVMANNGNNVGADGLTDSLRYAFGATGPGSISRTLLPSNSLVPGTNGTKNLVMTYFARTNENVSLLPWASANLSSSNGWTTNGIVVTVLSNVATNGTLLEKRQATTPATNSQKFLRLRSIFTE